MAGEQSPHHGGVSLKGLSLPLPLARGFEARRELRLQRAALRVQLLQLPLPISHAADTPSPHATDASPLKGDPQGGGETASILTPPDRQWAT